MSEGAPREPGVIDAPSQLPGAPMASTIGFDAICLDCKYNLRGLALGANCPECGKPVVMSLRKDLLRFADPGYVKTLHSGAVLVTIASFLPLVGFCMLLPIATMIEGVLRQRSGSTTTITTGNVTSHTHTVNMTEFAPVSTVLQAVFLLALIAVFALGWWKLAADDPSAQPDSQPAADRRFCRKMSKAFAAVAGISSLLPLGLFFGESLALTLLRIIFSLALLVVVVVMLTSGFRLLRLTTKRMAAPGLSKLSRLVYWLTLSPLILSVALLVVVAAVSGGGPGAAGSSGGPAQGVLAAILMMTLGVSSTITGVVGYVLFVVFFCLCTARLSELRRLSMATRSAAPMPLD